MKMIAGFKAARRVSTPLIAIRTPDAASTVREIVASIDSKENVPFLHWDVMRGLVGVGQAGKVELGRLFPNMKSEEISMATMRPSEMISQVEKVREDSIVFMANAQMFWADESVKQGVWNLRDQYKPKGAMFIMLTTGAAILPRELAEDVLVLDEPLPTMEELKAIITRTYEDARMKPPTEELMNKAVDALIGLAAFPAEQTLAMCLTKNGLDTKELWNRKCQVIEQTPGLSVWRGGESFEKIGGIQNAKKFARQLLKAKRRVRGIVFMDEIEKAFAGTGTDTSGVKTEMTGTFLSWMQDRGVRGALFIGPPGCTKSMFAKALGNEAGIPTISLDFGAMQSSLVGSSGERLRAGLKVIDAVTEGDGAVVIGTCNSINSLPPELRRRFSLGTFFFDLPSEEARKEIWKIYKEKFELKDRELPPDKDWTGAEIFECCRKAFDFGIPLVESGKYVVPVAKSAAEQIRTLRSMASGKFISAEEEGVYIYNGPPDPGVTATGRKMRMDIDGIQPKVGEA